MALDTLADPSVHDLLYGGAKGGGKSVFMCYWALLRCLELIDLFGIKNNRANPLPVGFLGRKRGSDFSKTTLETWRKFIPSEIYRIRTQDKEIIIDEKVKIYYGGLDDENNVKKFNSAEFAFVGVDQAEEIGRTDLALLKGTLRLVLNGKKPDYKVLLTANPAPCFLRQDYIERPSKGKVFIQALPADNPYLPNDYVDTLTEAFKHRPELVDAYVHGSWDQLEGADILIKHKWVLNCVNAPIRDNWDRRVTAVDVAGTGHNESVIYNMVDYRVVDSKIYGQIDPTILAGKIVELASRNNTELIVIDGDGMGGPVVAMVRKLLSNSKSNMSVYSIRSGKPPEDEQDKDRYNNQRTKMWFFAADKFAMGEVSIPDDPTLIGQLISLRYDPNGPGGKMIVEKKRDTVSLAEEGGFDRADALIYGIWGTSKVARKQIDFNRGEPQDNGQHGYGWKQAYGEAMSGAWSY